jgi:cytochrome c oxidase subunit 3
MVNPSPWPFMVAIHLFFVLYFIVLHLHDYLYSRFYFTAAIAILTFCISHWFYDIIVEATFEGHHTEAVKNNIRLGMLLFILSEFMFFFSFFWAFLYSAINPSVYIGCSWPPVGIEPINPFGLPLLNTVILFSSSISLTWAHRAIAHSPAPESTSSIVQDGSKDTINKVSLYRDTSDEIKFFFYDFRYAY